MSNISENLIETLIKEVEKRPALYNRNLKEYSDANLKIELWDEVCEVIISDWNYLADEEKRKQVHEIRKKWSNLRTCFRRELNAQEYTKSGRAGTKRRKYIYFEQLLFLLPCVENHHKESNVSPANDEDDDETSDPPTTSVRRRKKACKPKQTSSDIDETFSKALDDTKDEDTYFALSLVPSLRALPPEEKLDAKINILNVFKQIIMARRGQT